MRETEIFEIVLKIFNSLKSVVQTLDHSTCLIILTTFIAAFAGSLLGVRLNYNKAKKKDCKNQSEKIKLLFSLCNNIFHDMISYKKQSLGAKKRHFLSRNFANAAKKYSYPTFVFPIVPDEYLFLINENPTIYTLVLKILEQVKILETTFSEHDIFSEVIQMQLNFSLKELSTEQQEKLLCELNSLTKNSDLLLYFCYLLMKFLSKYSKKHTLVGTRGFSAKISEEDNWFIPSSKSYQELKSFEEELELY